METRLAVDIAGAHRLLCECLARALAADGRWEVRDDGDDFDAVESRFRRGQGGDLLLIDLSMARDAALELGRAIGSDPRFSVLYLGVEPDRSVTEACISTGGKGLAEIGQSLDQLRPKIEAVLRGELAFDPPHVAIMRDRLTQLSRKQRRRVELDPVDLTPRETEVLALIAAGKRNKEIAAELGLSVHTVKNHVHNVLVELEASGGRVDAVRRARAKGLI